MKSKEVIVVCPIHHIKLSYVYFSRKGRLFNFEDLGYCEECNKIYKITAKEYDLIDLKV